MAFTSISDILIDNQDVDKADLREYLKNGEIVNVKNYGADSTGTEDSTSAFTAALATGKSVFAPEGVYLIGESLSLGTGGQMLFGAGYGPANTATSSDAGTTLRWTGASGDFIKFSSGRNGAETSDTVTGLQLRNLKLETAAGSALDRLIWIEDGVFHSVIEKVHVRGLEGVPSQAIIKFESNGGFSYPVGMILRDLTLRGQADGNGDPTPIGIWVESAIETLLERVVVYDVEEGFVLGNSDPDEYRIVTNLRAIACQADLVLGRAGVTDAGANLRIYQAVNMTWLAGKFLAGSSDSTQTNIRPIKFSGVTGGESRNISFIGTQFDAQARAHYAFEFESGATDFRDVNFDQCDFSGLVTGIATIDAAAHPIINWGKSNTYDGVVPEPNFSYRARAVTVDPSSLDDGAGETVAALTDFSVNNLRPLLFSFSNDLQGIILTGYKSGGATTAVRFQNETGGTIDLASGTLLVRPLDDHEIARSSTTTYDPPTLADGAGITATVTVPGAAMGDFAFANYFTSASGNLNGIILTAYVSAADTVSVRFQNETGVSRNLPSADLRAGTIAPVFDCAGSATYDPASLADGAGVTTTVTATGAKVGDFAVASFSNDLQGIIMTAWVSAADTVSVRFQNETGGTIDLASGTLRVGVFKDGA